MKSLHPILGGKVTRHHVTCKSSAAMRLPALVHTNAWLLSAEFMTITRTNTENRNLCNDNTKYAVIRVDTHGNRFVVQQYLSSQESEKLVADFDKLTHHQGYYRIGQSQIEDELKRS